MHLKDLTATCTSLTVLVVQSPSETLKLFIQDRIKEKFKANRDSIFTVDSKKSLKDASTLSVIQPFSAEKWIFLTDLDKVPYDEFLRVAEKCETGLFICTTSKYFIYKRIKEKFKASESFADLYLAYLKRMDFLYLYNWFVPKEVELTKALYDYVLKNYSSDIDAVFALFRALQSGEVVESKRDVSSLCGLGGNTTDSFIIGVLKSEPKTEKGLKSVIRNKLQAGMDLSQDLPWGKMWAYAIHFTRNLIQVKQLYIAGEIYATISNVPEGYDAKQLVRLNRYLWFIKDTPMSKLLQLAVLLEDDKWTCDLQFIHFIYEYYKIDVSKRVLDESTK